MGIFAVARVYAIAYCYAYGYGRDPTMIVTYAGIPDWVFWGYLCPKGILVYSTPGPQRSVTAYYNDKRKQ